MYLQTQVLEILVHIQKYSSTINVTNINKKTLHKMFLNLSQPRQIFNEFEFGAWRGINLTHPLP